MGYYWSSTCHNIGTYGTDVYDSQDTSGCSGHNDYTESKVKEFLDTVYIKELNASNLKEINGYKLRLITTNELINNLGWTGGPGTKATDTGNNVPIWVYKNFGVYAYWTMTKRNINGANDFAPNNGGVIETYSIQYNNCGVRPVINLYKAAID